MGVLDNLSNVRYSNAVETYSRELARVNAGRTGALATAAAAAGRSAQHAESDQAESPLAKVDAPPPPPPSVMTKALMAVGKGMQALTDLEASLTAPVGKIPWPSMPALRIWDLDVGLPHAHNHPPNITPPSPVPIPLPSMGPVIPIPILSGAKTVIISGSPAARCGDMGLGVWCGGYFPMFEIFLGSSNVWIEGARAARIVTDITKHCTFSAPKPSDPPLGPMIGTTLPPGSPNVMIGGFPLPSFTSLAIAQAFKAVFKVGGAILRKVTAKSYIAKLLKDGALVLDNVHAPPGWADDMMNDLQKIASTRTGREVLNRIAKSGKKVNLIHYDGFFPTQHGPQWSPHNAWAMGHSDDALMDIPTGLKMPGDNSTVAHNPAFWSNHPSGGIAGPPAKTSSDGILLHELNHAANNSEGAGRAAGTASDPAWNQRWQNFEEYNTVATENGYRAENGLPGRTSYNSPFP